MEGSEDSVDQAGWSSAFPLANSTEEAMPPVESHFEEIKQDLLSRYPKIVFTDEKNATITDQIQCKLYMKSDKPIRSGIRALGFHKREWLRKHIEELLNAGVIQYS